MPVSATPSRALVTGAAGFIGSNLVDALINRGCTVDGIDSFTNYYSARVKNNNLANAMQSDRFRLLALDVGVDALEPHLEGVDTVFHLAAQPGVRSSWATEFPAYVQHNIVATYRLLEACRSFPNIRVVNASSSSVYGNATRYPTSEDSPTEPISPYGVTKLAAEQLVHLYGATLGVSTVSLRYFSVYGPRQRPDMATHRLIEATLTDTDFPLLGDGRQERDFTFVEDVVEANLLAATADVPGGSVYNVAGGSSISMFALIDLVASQAGKRVRVSRQPPMHGDAAKTGGDISKAQQDLGWRPNTELEQGVKLQIAWHLASRP